MQETQHRQMLVNGAKLCERKIAEASIIPPIPLVTLHHRLTCLKHVYNGFNLYQPVSCNYFFLHALLMPFITDLLSLQF